MEVTLVGRVTLVRPVHQENAPSPMEVTLVPMVTLVSPEQPEKAPLPMEVTLLGIRYTPPFPVGNLMIDL